MTFEQNKHAGDPQGTEHSHDHMPKSFGTAFALGTGLNIAFVVIEASFGFWSNRSRDYAGWPPG